MVNEMALEDVILLVFQVSPVIIISPALHTHILPTSHRQYKTLADYSVFNIVLYILTRVVEIVDYLCRKALRPSVPVVLLLVC
jgi:hypothetical protein